MTSMTPHLHPRTGRSFGFATGTLAAGERGPHAAVCAALHGTFRWANSFSDMAEYIIKPHGGDQAITQPCRCELPSLAAVRAEALAAARSLLTAKVWVGKMLDGQRLELWDDAGRMLATIWLSEE